MKSKKESRLHWTAPALRFPGSSPAVLLKEAAHCVSGADCFLRLFELHAVCLLRRLSVPLDAVKKEEIRTNRKATVKLVDSIFINCPAEIVWAFLENPANMILWNPKVKHVSPSSFAGIQKGYRYAISYQMHERAKVSEFLAEFVHFEPPSKLVIRHTGGISPHKRAIEEIYELSEREGRTFLTQSIHIDNSGINIFIRILIWIIQRWGKPTGKRYLETLRDIIERNAGLTKGHNTNVSPPSSTAIDEA